MFDSSLRHQNREGHQQTLAAFVLWLLKIGTQMATEALGPNAIGTRSNLHVQRMDVDKQARCRLNGQKPCVVWFTGLSGSGKSSIANHLEKKLHQMGHRTYLLDGDNIRQGLNKDLGFTETDRVENIRRVAEVARLMVDAGLVVLAAFISPFEAERRMARAMVDEGEFLEIHLDVPLAVAEQRDPKGLYRKAKTLPGVQAPYEPPLAPELVVHGAAGTPADAAGKIVALLADRGWL